MPITKSLFGTPWNVVVIATILLLAVYPAEVRAEGKRRVKSLYTRADERESNIRIINGSTWTDTVVSDLEQPWLIKLYTSTCKHCKESAPHIKGVAQALSGIVNVGVVNCKHQANNVPCTLYAKEGYPSIWLFPAGPKETKKPVQYRYARQGMDIANFAIGNLPKVAHMVAGKDIETWRATEPGLPHILMVTPNQIMDPRFQSFAFFSRRRAAFAQVYQGDMEFLKQYDVKKVPSLLVFPPMSHKSNPILKDDGIDYPQFFPWLQQYILQDGMGDPAPGGYQKLHERLDVSSTPFTASDMTSAQFNASIAAKETMLVQFCHDWMTHCEQARLLLEDVSTAFKGTSLRVYRFDIDNDGDSLPIFRKMPRTRVPAMVLFKNGEVSSMYDGAIDFDEFIKWAAEQSGITPVEVEPSLRRFAAATEANKAEAAVDQANSDGSEAQAEADHTEL